MTERADSKMPDPDEKTMREVFDRLHAIERQQSDSGRTTDTRMASIETQAALDRKDTLNALNSIKDMLGQILNGETKNCLVHKAELDALKLLVENNHDEFVTFRKDRVEALGKKADKTSVNALWWVCSILGAALLTGFVAHIIGG